MGLAWAAHKHGQNVRGPQSLTVAILAQGTHWAVAVTQALFVIGSIPASSVFRLELLHALIGPTGTHVGIHQNEGVHKWCLGDGRHGR